MRVGLSWRGVRVEGGGDEDFEDGWGKGWKLQGGRDWRISFGWLSWEFQNMLEGGEVDEGFYFFSKDDYFLEIRILSMDVS